MSYAYIDYKDEDEIYSTYSQAELEVRQDYIKMIEGSSTELIYEAVDVRKTDPNVIETLIGPAGSDSFKAAFILYIKRMAGIFFTLDPYDLIPLAVDLMDHYMNLHKSEKLPFDPTSGRSSTFYMDMIRLDEEVKPLLASEMPEEDLNCEDASAGKDSSKARPVDPSLFYERIHSTIKSNNIPLSRIYQVDLFLHRYRQPDFVGKLPWEEDYDPDGGYDSLTVRLCASAEGQPFRPHVHRDYDFNVDSFPTFLAELKDHCQASPENPMLVLMCRRVKALSLDVIYFCQQNGIFLYAFPAFCPSLEPLSTRLIPQIKKQFSAVYQQKYRENKNKILLDTPDRVASFMKSVVKDVQDSSVDLVLRDFRKCLQLDQCMELRPLDEEMESSSSSQQAEEGGSAKKQEMDSGFVDPFSEAVSDVDMSVGNLKLKRKKPRREAETELNELMFAQIGPLKESDYY